MINLIKKFYDENAVVSIYKDFDDTAVCEVGYINTYNDDEILLSSINKRGEYDGYILLHIDDIFRIEANGKYEEKMKKLYSLKKQKHEKFELANDGVAYRIFDFAKENNLIVCFDFEDDCRRGFVQRYEENICIIKTVTDYSEPDGEAIIDIDQANSISLDTDFEQDLKLVFESRN